MLPNETFAERDVHGEARTPPYHFIEAVPVPCKRAWRGCGAASPGQRYQAGPELLSLCTGFDVVFAHETELAVTADPIHRDGRRKSRDFAPAAWNNLEIGIAQRRSDRGKDGSPHRACRRQACSGSRSRHKLTALPGGRPQDFSACLSGS